MNICVLSKAEIFGEKKLLGVYSKLEIAEKAVKSKYPYAKQDAVVGSTITYLITPKDCPKFLLFIDRVEIFDTPKFPDF